MNSNKNSNVEYINTAEEVLREYIDFDDVNGSESVDLLPLTIVSAMEEYAEQFENNNDHRKLLIDFVIWMNETSITAQYETLIPESFVDYYIKSSGNF